MNIFSSVLLMALAAASRGRLKTLEDVKLVELFNGGEALAFEELFDRYEKRIFYFILRSVKDRERAEELAQDVFLRVINSIDLFEQTAAFKSWLFTIARNICIDHARRQKHRKTRSLQDNVSASADDDREWLELVVDIEASSGDSEVARAEFRRTLELALAELPDEQRRTFLLRESEGLKYREIAEIEEIPENTVKSRMRYALQTLQAHLSEYEGFSFDAAEREEVAPNASQKQV